MSDDNTNLKKLIYISDQNQLEEKIEPLNSIQEQITEITKIVENEAYYFDLIDWN